jgi:hypothetical protein
MFLFVLVDCRQEYVLDWGRKICVGVDKGERGIEKLGKEWRESMTQKDLSTSSP